MPRSPRAARLSVLLAAAVAATLMTSTPAAVAAAEPTPTAPVPLPSDVEALSRYTAATSCDPTAKPGVVKFAALVQATYEGTGSSGIVRTCDAARSVSEHTEGRAWDWRVSRTDPAQVAQVAALHAWLLAPDAAGNQAANARRLGLMYIIWDSTILHLSDPAAGWRPYSCSGVTGCHEDHVHYSFTWAGAQGRTSFWTGAVAPADYGPCREPGRMFAAPYRAPNGSPCPAWRPLPADSPLVARIAAVQGQRLQVGSTGDAVSTLQTALGGGAATGRFETATRGLVALFQSRRGLTRTGQVERTTWASLASYLTGGAVTLAPAPAAPAPPAPPTGPAPDPAPEPAPAPSRVLAEVGLSRTPIRLTTSSSLTVRVSADARGRTVVRQQRVSGRWVSLDRARLDAKGRHGFVVTPTSRGVKTYRVVLPAERGAAAVTSRRVRLTVR